MRLLILLPLLLCFTAMGQVSLIIADETGSGFKLGINGYAQNTEPVKELVINKLDTFPFEVRVELAPQAFFTKQIHFHEKGNYRYVVTTNSRDELQLRYRGKAGAIPTTATVMDVQHETPLRPLASATRINTKALPGSIDETQEEKPDVPAPKPQTAAFVEEKQQPATVPSIKESEENISSEGSNENPAGITSPQQEKTPPPAIQTFDAFLTELEATEFEFEKLNKSREFAQKHPYKASELKKIFEAMNYDNTRLALVRALLPELKEISGLDGLRESFEYEISKQTFNDILDL